MAGPPIGTSYAEMMRMCGRIVSSVVLIVTISAVAGCRRGVSPADVTIALQEIVAGSPLIPVQTAVWTDVRQFYNARGGTPAWVQNGNREAVEAQHLLRRAVEHGFAPADYGEAQVAALIARLDRASEQKEHAAADAR